MFNVVAEHYKLTVSGMTENYTKVSDFSINIQPASAEISVVMGGVYGKTYTGFTTYSGLYIGDRVKTEREFKVSGILDNHIGPIPHYEVTLTEPE